MMTHIKTPLKTPTGILGDKLSAVREVMAANQLDGFIVPRSDEFQNEYVPPKAERLLWLTGFSGSAGLCCVLKHKAVVMSDGRYTIQLKQQVDLDKFETADSTKQSPFEWLAINAATDHVIGYDPWLHTERQIRHWAEKLAAEGIFLKPVAFNVIDHARYTVLKEDVPESAPYKIELFPEEIAGQSSQQKRQEIATLVQEKKCAALIITLPDSLSWLLNVRGKDVAHNPVVLSYGILWADDATLDWFVDKRKVNESIITALGRDVRIHDISDIHQSLSQLKNKLGQNSIWIDGQRSSSAFFTILNEQKIKLHDERDPVIWPKAQKTIQEQNAMRAAHIRDGAAVTRFLHWLDQEVKKGNDLNEISIADKLEWFRQQDKKYKDTSFDTIAGWNKNGAIVHYRATPENHAVIKGAGVLLLDSGAQYEDGTTDITRTIALADKDFSDVAKHFTLVLKGHIALAMAEFPLGTTGAQLDILARKPLQDNGLDYAHGTGHGVGCYLSVHEEAASISPRGAEAVLAGMIISNEPGYYKEGAYGIRIENLILCRDTGKRTDQHVSVLCFETLTCAPLDSRLIIAGMLNEAERNWVNRYHRHVYETVSPMLDADAQTWLKAVTAAI